MDTDSIDVKGLLKNKNLFKQQAYINGKWVQSDSGRTTGVYNPFNNKLIGSIPNLTAKETTEAIHAANNAQKLWQGKTAKERSLVLNKWKDLIIDNADDLAILLTLEQGKPLKEAQGEITYSLSYLEWFAEEAKRISGNILSPTRSNLRQSVYKQAIGVCAAIIAWNFPTTLVTRKASPALAAGCSMVLKPSELAPFSVLAMAYLSELAGIPAGVFNVVTGIPQEIGAELTSNHIVRKLTFTGSTAVGRKLMEQSSTNIKNLSLELGGNAPFIVLEDADLDNAVEGLVFAKFRNAGQTCISPNRVYVHKNVVDNFVSKLVDKVKSIKTGDGLDDSSDIGPLISDKAVGKVERLLDDALAKGATLLTGGKLVKENSYMFEPTVITGVNKKMLIAKEEIFGPVIAISSYASAKEMLLIANDSEYGLAAYVYTENRKNIQFFSEELEFGVVGVNTGAISNEVSPFGGIKSSGLGREGSMYGIEEYLDIKSVSFGLD